MLNVIRSYRRFSLSLIAFVLIGAVGLRLDVHYCQGHLAGISLILPDMSCCSDDQNDSSCCDQEESELPCCEDKEHIATLDFEAPLSQLLEYNDVDFDHSDAWICTDEVEQKVVSHSDLKNTGPPRYLSPSGMEIRILFQSFIC